MNEIWYSKTPLAEFCIYKLLNHYYYSYKESQGEKWHEGYHFPSYTSARSFLKKYIGNPGRMKRVERLPWELI
ncbi:hypothetical protein SJY89_20240 [Bacillus velezensis]|uniref:hypothetical protein n=1 Tax=Bacillus TaxID=1386 RepID=UPI000652BB63|nr:MULTISPECIES: hypothetical protein [Bacillus]APA05083.1 hypothetical protein BK055_21170 [Bacillus velezensis]KMN56381.1 hypothetical protein VK94_08210 [Bacillus sp. LK7]MCW5196276.1 hypothetical protein [Bacillus amyloliquefaciens]MDU0078291.1 hypothetical protein [Bacillus sp. IG2]MDU0103957.1 hypothetical protein [Bacillus sp. IS1]